VLNSTVAFRQMALDGVAGRAEQAQRDERVDRVARCALAHEHGLQKRHVRGGDLRRVVKEQPTRFQAQRRAPFDLAGFGQMRARFEHL
jgi:hypothetical protein